MSQAGQTFQSQYQVNHPFAVSAYSIFLSLHSSSWFLSKLHLMMYQSSILLSQKECLEHLTPSVDAPCCLMRLTAIFTIMHMRFYLWMALLFSVTFFCIASFIAFFSFASHPVCTLSACNGPSVNFFLYINTAISSLAYQEKKVLWGGFLFLCLQQQSSVVDLGH